MILNQRTLINTWGSIDILYIWEWKTGWGIYVDVHYFKCPSSWYSRTPGPEMIAFSLQTIACRLHWCCLTTEKIIYMSLSLSLLFTVYTPATSFILVQFKTTTLINYVPDPTTWIDHGLIRESPDSTITSRVVCISLRKKPSRTRIRDKK